MSAESADIAVAVAAVFDHASHDRDSAGARAVALNERLCADTPTGFSLDATHIPHLTLAQLFIAEEDFVSIRGAVAAVLGRVNADARPLITSVDSISLGRADDGGRVAAFDVRPTPGLQRLHDHIVDAVGPYSRFGGGADAFVGAGVEPHSVTWVEDFFTDASGSHFAPHITLGIGSERVVGDLRAEFVSFPLRIDRVAVCRLGARNTCHDVVADWSWG